MEKAMLCKRFEMHARGGVEAKEGRKGVRFNIRPSVRMSPVIDVVSVQVDWFMAILVLPLGQ